MYLARQLTAQSLPEIGNAFGGKDHTTVLHSCKKIGQSLISRQGNKEHCGSVINNSTTIKIVVHVFMHTFFSHNS